MNKASVCKKSSVTIGLPVFNGEKYLTQALDSILSQTYQDFNVIISDNASTDNTPNICRRYAAKDSRIHYYRNPRNLGIAANFNHVFQLSSSKYFKWVACDDVHAIDFLEKCVKILDSNPEVVLCHTKTGRINYRGEHIGKYDFKLRIDSPKPHERFGDLICMNNDAWVLIFGLIRADALRKTQLLGSYIGADRNLLAELSLIGRFFIIPEYLFFRRAHPQAYTNNANFTIKQKLTWWTGSEQSRTVFPYWKICLEYFNLVKKMSLSFFERQQCYARIIKWIIEEGWVLMYADIGINLLDSFKFKKKLAPLYQYFLKRAGIC